MDETERELITNNLNKYKWYHRIKVTDELYTPPNDVSLQPLWDFILHSMNGVDFNGKRVLDVGCRDGLFSFEAEKRHAREVLGIDNDLSPGTTEYLIPLLQSKVRMYKTNLYDLSPEKLGTFDAILFFGVLYHLRYPIWGLKKLVDCLSDKGFLLIESGMLVDPSFQELDFIYCPVEDSPYEPTSCTFFNQKGLITTMRSLGCKFVDCKTLGRDFINENERDFLIRCLKRLKNELRAFRPKPNNTPKINRQFLTFQKDVTTSDTFLSSYWNDVHDYHTEHGT